MEQHEELTLTEEEKEQGWLIERCSGNAYADACRKPYKKLNWYTPSSCPHCRVTFID